jgi:hypothetical protein
MGRKSAGKRLARRTISSQTGQNQSFPAPRCITENLHPVTPAFLLYTAPDPFILQASHRTAAAPAANCRHPSGIRTRKPINGMRFVIQYAVRRMNPAAAFHASFPLMVPFMTVKVLCPKWLFFTIFPQWG